MEGASGKCSVDDGTEEKLVTQDDPLNDVNKEKNQVKFTSEVQNGETKMECDMRRAFVGMGKEELMKFANDPFWVFIRKFLFVLFWIMWAAMLLGSIAIIVYSPKCTSATKPWFQSSAIYKFDIKAFEHGSLHNRIGDLKALKDHLEYFEYLGVDSILVGSLMETADGDRQTVKDFKKIDSAYGSLEILKDLTARMKKKNMHLVMSFDPNYSSDRHEWFRNSIARIDPYTNYYVWAKGSLSSEDDSVVPPNNWLSMKGGSAWSYVKERKQFYLHQFSSHQPDLNFHEPKVVDYMKEVLLFWLEKGLSGIHLDNVKFLIEDMSLANETINPVNPLPGSTHDHYGFYTHSHTSNIPLTFDIINQWANIVRSHGDILSVSDISPESVDPQVVIHHTLWLNSFINATEFNNAVKFNLGRSNPSWQWQCNQDCPDEATSKALMALFVLLPGSTVIRGGEELPWIPSSNKPWSSLVTNGSLSNKFDYFLDTIEEEKAKPESYLNLLKKVLSLRNKDAFKLGSTAHNVFNSSVFAFARVDPTQSYLVAFNFDELEKNVSFSKFDHLNNETDLKMILTTRPNPEAGVVDETTKPFVTIPGKTLVVFEFTVPAAVTSA